MYAYRLEVRTWNSGENPRKEKASRVPCGGGRHRVQNWRDRLSPKDLSYVCMRKCVLRRTMDWCNGLNISQIRPGREGGNKRHLNICTPHVSNSIVRVPRDANTLRTLAGRDFGASCLQYNKFIISHYYFVRLWANRFEPSRTS